MPGTGSELVQDIFSGIHITIMLTSTFRTNPLEQILLGSVCRRGQRAEIPMNMQPTDTFPLKRDDMVSVMRYPAFSGNAGRFGIHRCNGLVVSPRRASHQNRGFSLGRCGSVCRSISSVMRVSDGLHPLGVLLPPNPVHNGKCFCIFGVVARVALLCNDFGFSPHLGRNDRNARFARSVHRHALGNVSMLAGLACVVGRQAKAFGFGATPVNRNHFCFFKKSSTARRISSETETSNCLESSCNRSKAGSGRKKCVRFMHTSCQQAQQPDSFAAALYLPGLKAGVSREVNR